MAKTKLLNHLLKSRKKLLSASLVGLGTGLTLSLLAQSTVVSANEVGNQTSESNQVSLDSASERQEVPAGLESSLRPVPTASSPSSGGAVAPALPTEESAPASWSAGSNSATPEQGAPSSIVETDANPVDSAQTPTVDQEPAPTDQVPTPELPAQPVPGSQQADNPSETAEEAGQVPENQATSPLQSSATVAEVQATDPGSLASTQAGQMSEDGEVIELSDNAIRSQSQGLAIENRTITLSRAGNYVLTGAADGVQVLIPETVRGAVRLTLNNATMTGNQAAVVSRSSGPLTIIAKAGTTNRLADLAWSQNEAVIESLGDLYFNGAGVLAIASNKGDAVKSAGSITINGGTYNISSSTGDGLKAKKHIRITNATMDMATADDAIVSSNDETVALSNVTITNSSIRINADGDAIHASNHLLINSGQINIQSSKEGLEGKVVTIRDGQIDIVASDDGINAANEDSDTASQFSLDDKHINIHGGRLFIRAGGDGMDSNGTINITGGQTYITGSTEWYNATLDYSKAAKISGGTFIAMGASGMAQGLGYGSTQSTIFLNILGKAWDWVRIVDQAGQEVASFQSQGDFDNLVYSAPNLVAGQHYYVTTSTTTSPLLAIPLLENPGMPPVVIFE